MGESFPTEHDSIVPAELWDQVQAKLQARDRPYGMTKAAVNSLTWTSAADGKYGIRVNAIAPGWIETLMSRNLFMDATGQISPELRETVEKGDGSEIAAWHSRPVRHRFWARPPWRPPGRVLTGQVLSMNGERCNMS